MAKKKTAAVKSKSTAGQASSGTRAVKKKAAPKRKATAVAELSRCPNCGSTDREPYHHPRELEQGGIDLRGGVYTHIVWRNTTCRGCGQNRVDRAYENRVAGG